MRNVAAASRMVAASLATVVALSACAPKADTTQDTLTQSSAAGMVADIKVAEVQVGKAVGADMKVTTPTLTFSTKDTVHVAVSTTGSMTDATMTLMVKPAGDTTVVHTDPKTLSPTGPAVTSFKIANPAVLKPGKYVVEVFLNGGLADMKEITIVR